MAIESELFILHAELGPLRGPLGMIFCNSVSPAFKAQAESIEIMFDCRPAVDFDPLERTKIHYFKDGVKFDLEPDREFNPLDIFPIIKIASRMSILREPMQAGSMRMRWRESDMVVEVESRLLENEEMLRFVPLWRTFALW